MGGKSDDRGDAAAQVANRQADIAEQLVRETGPVRGNLLRTAQRMTSGGFGGVNDPLFSSPTFQAAKAMQDAQFQRAREAAIAHTPEGGGLSTQLTNLEMGRALGETDAAGRIMDTEVNRAVQLASGGTAQGVQAYGQAGSTAAQLAQMEAQQNAAKGGGLGYAAGTAIGMK